MTHVLLERSFDPPIGRTDVLGMSGRGARCFSLYRVDWCGSMLSLDGQRMFCHFISADAESVRNAMRQVGADVSRLWPGTLHDAPGVGAEEAATGNVLVFRHWDTPVTLSDIQAIEDAGAWCLEAHGVTFLRTFFSTDRRRMACLYRAPDAESVRLAQGQAGMPFDRIWACELIGPSDTTR